MYLSIAYNPSTTSNLVYTLQRLVLRIQDNFIVYLSISLIITVIVTWLYYKYLTDFFRAEALRLLTFWRPRPKRQEPSHAGRAARVYSRKRRYVKERRTKTMAQFENEPMDYRQEKT